MKFDRCDQTVFRTSRLTEGSPQVNPPAATGTEVTGICWIDTSLAPPVSVTRA